MADGRTSRAAIALCDSGFKVAQELDGIEVALVVPLVVHVVPATSISSRGVANKPVQRAHCHRGRQEE